ncbi:MAG: nuclear transport factor 2 family protein [Pseudolabrys sp.]
MPVGPVPEAIATRRAKRNSGQSAEIWRHCAVGVGGILPSIFRGANVLEIIQEMLAARIGKVILGTRGGASVADTRATVRELIAAYARRDFDAVAALIHDDIDWVIYAPVGLFRFAGPRQGRVAVMRALADIAEDYVLECYIPEIVAVDGERAAVMADVGFVQRATARTLRFRVADFLRFADGRLIEFREFSNTFDVVEQALGRELEFGP